MIESYMKLARKARTVSSAMGTLYSRVRLMIFVKAPPVDLSYQGAFLWAMKGSALEGVCDPDKWGYFVPQSPVIQLDQHVKVEEKASTRI
jgi:hypothetical protein